MVKNEIESDLCWNLKDIYYYESASKYKSDLALLQEKASVFQQKYQNNLKDYVSSSGKLRSILDEIDDYWGDLESIVLYGELRYYADMLNPLAQEIQNISESATTYVKQTLSFFRMEIRKCLYKYPKIIDSLDLLPYRHYLDRILMDANYEISTDDENLILEKDQDGVNAWSKFQAQWLANQEVSITLDGTTKNISLLEMHSYMEHPNREIRLAVLKNIGISIQKDQLLHATALRSIVNNFVNETIRRGYESPVQSTLLRNDLTIQSLENLMQVVRNNSKHYQNYLQLKKNLIKVKDFEIADINAPLPSDSPQEYSWDQVKILMKQIYGQFDSEFENIVDGLFQQSRIDAVVRKGKFNGAFSYPIHNKQTAYILLNYDNKMYQVYTLAHELGHAIHACLATKIQPYVNFNDSLDDWDAISSCLDETASVFGELLLTDWLLQHTESKNDQIVILERVINYASINIFQTSINYLFEKTLYRAVLDNEYLDGSSIDQYWTQAQKQIYGNVVKIIPEASSLWGGISHLFLPHQRFYNYPYIFSQLFVYALYNLYKKNPEDFVPKFKKFLESGASISCSEAAQIFGFNLESTEFWQLGMDLYSSFLEQLQILKHDSS